MYETECPFCGTEIVWSEKPRLGQTVYCRACNSKSKVSSVSPFELDDAVWEKNSWKGHRDKKMHVRPGKNGYSDFEEDNEEEFDPDEPTHRIRRKRTARLKQQAKKHNYR
jgi:lysine biosynthesis protein LysW